MFKENLNIDKYINFLYYGHDIASIFNRTDLVSIYKNKYKRILSSNNSFENLTNINSVKLIFNNFIDSLKKENFTWVNNDKIFLVNKLFKSLSYDRLIFNNKISISFLEVIETDIEWRVIKSKVMDVAGEEYKKFLFDDSNNNYKILTFEINVDYQCGENNKCPDITTNNIEVINNYINIFNGNYELLDNSLINDYMKTSFDKELYLYTKEGMIDSNNILASERIYYDFFVKIYTLNFADINISELREIYLKIINHINNDNIHLILSLQFLLIQSLSRKQILGSHMILKLITTIALDIFIYNKTRDITDKNVLDKVFSTYNYYIIKLKDMIDESDDRSNKKTSLIMYRNQLNKSRNKLQERMCI